jgi:transposase
MRASQCIFTAALTPTPSASASASGVLPKRWIVEQTFAWISRYRRLSRDFERYATTIAAFLHPAIMAYSVSEPHQSASLQRLRT